MKKRHAIVSVTNDLLTDNRVNKVCTFLHDKGFRVTLVGRIRKDSLELNDRPYRMVRFKLPFEKGALFYISYNIRLFAYLLTHRCNLLVANDLDTLLANYAAHRFKVGTRLVYDSHEYFTEVPELIHRKRVQHFWETLEAWIFPKVRTLYTVNHSIANLYEEKYRKKMRVVRNVPPLWKPVNVPSKAALGIPENTFLVVLQGAGINIDRGAEEALEAIAQIEGCCLMLIGDGDVVPQLKKEVHVRGLGEKILFFGKRPYEEMMHYTFHADVGLSLDKSNNINYRFSLPNKIFDYMHAGTAIVCTDLPEVSAVVHKHETGIVLPELTVEALKSVLISLMEDPQRLNELKANCLEAAKMENWEHECSVLEEVYGES
jgi:glycosyltransferase involved in cell wall biosynthesis